MAEVNRKVSEIHDEALREVSTYYKEFDEYPNLRIYLDKLRTTGEALTKRTTLIFTTDVGPWDVFNAQAREAVPVKDGLVGEGARSVIPERTTGNPD